MIADISFLIDLMKNQPEALAKAREIEKNGTSLKLCTRSIFELSLGITLTTKPNEEMKKILNVLASLPILLLDYQSAVAAGSIYGEKLKGGARIDPEDAMIAGIAQIANEPILIRNLRHFWGIDGVTV